MKVSFPNLDSYLGKTIFFVPSSFIPLTQLGLVWKQMTWDGVVSVAVNPST